MLKYSMEKHSTKCCYIFKFTSIYIYMYIYIYKTWNDLITLSTSFMFICSVNAELFTLYSAFVWTFRHSKPHIYQKSLFMRNIWSPFIWLICPAAFGPVWVSAHAASEGDIWLELPVFTDTELRLMSEKIQHSSSAYLTSITTQHHC